MPSGSGSVCRATKARFDVHLTVFRPDVSMLRSCAALRRRCRSEPASGACSTRRSRPRCGWPLAALTAEMRPLVQPGHRVSCRDVVPPLRMSQCHSSSQVFVSRRHSAACESGLDWDPMLEQAPQHWPVERGTRESHHRLRPCRVIYGEVRAKYVVRWPDFRHGTRNVCCARWRRRDLEVVSEYRLSAMGSRRICHGEVVPAR